MSEELLQIEPIPLARYSYYKLGGSTLEQLRRAKIITVSIDKELAKKKPDGLILLPHGAIKAVIEYKQPSVLKTQRQQKAAIAQEIAVAKQLCKILIVTDGSKTLWVNALSGNPIIDEKGIAIGNILDVRKFHKNQINQLSPEEIADFEDLLDRMDHSLTSENDVVSTPALLDPSPLAEALWQKIWINTGKEPEKCLYNVVEIFLFKFLSDLNVLKASNSFSAIYKLKIEDPDLALEQYASMSRKEIRKLFPEGEDGTTIINGTIFVNEKGEPNHAQAHLFGEILEELYKYGDQFGSFKYIQRDFKTRLYESFLRQSAGVKKLGQYFTPRNVVRAMVKMSSASTLGKQARICDPFCGVGGFILETIVENPNIYSEFEPRNGVVNPGITLLGYDKGSDEKDDERTIILAKANMLIYFSDLLARYHNTTSLKAFSDGAFNSVFHLLRSNLGTFSLRGEKPFDLILTNPPYVTSGVGSLKRAIEYEGLNDYYSSGGRGTEALAMEWIVRNLAPGGQALVVVPDGLMKQRRMIDFLTSQCNIQAILSLPVRTFYSTRKKTYILVLTKKRSEEREQINPIFCYLVSETGETRDTYRFPIDQNDLDEAVALFNQFKGSPHRFEPQTLRCKIVSSREIISAPHWLIDALWTDEEKKELGIKEIADEMSEEDFVALMEDTKKKLEDFIGEYSNSKEVLRQENCMQLFLQGDWFEYIQSKTGWTKTEYRQMDTSNETDIPVYSAAKHPVAYVDIQHQAIIKADQANPVISFASNGDGSAGTNFVLHTCPFYVSNDRTCLRVLNKEIDTEFVLFSLLGIKQTYGFNHSFKATKRNLEGVSFTIPIKDSEGVTFDVNRQKDMVVHFKKLYEMRKSLEAQLSSTFKSTITFEP